MQAGKVWAACRSAILTVGTILLVCAGGAAWSAPQDEVVVGFGNRLPPYVFPEQQTGMIVEIFREALASQGYRLKPVFLPLKREAMLFDEHKIDAAMLDFYVDMTKPGNVYGAPAFVYHNVLITLANRHLKIERPADLQNLSVLAFQGALGLYPEWLRQVNAAGRYQETNNQALQVLTLGDGGVDVVLSDRVIFDYFRRQAQSKHGSHGEVFEEHDLIANRPDLYRTVFHDEKVRDAYNAGLTILMKSQRYDQIVKSFMERPVD